MKAPRLGPWILITCGLGLGSSPVFGFGEFFDGSVKTTRRIAAVDSSSYAILFTAAGTVAQNSVIEGAHFLLDDGNFRAAGGEWIGITEYVGYIRAPIQEGRCYRATFDAFHPSSNAFGIWVSSPVCIHQHSSECGHCGPGTGNVCQQGVEEGRD